MAGWGRLFRNLSILSDRPRLWRAGENQSGRLRLLIDRPPGHGVDGVPEENVVCPRLSRQFKLAHKR